MSATDVLNQITAAIEVIAELPLRVFDIKITRKEDDHVCIRLTRVGETIEVTGKVGRRTTIDKIFINSKVGGQLYTAAQCTGMLAITATSLFNHTVTDAGYELTTYDPSFSKKPSDKAVDAYRAAMKSVAERILTRFSRVDLL